MSIPITTTEARTLKAAKLSLSDTPAVWNQRMALLTEKHDATKLIADKAMARFNELEAMRGAIYTRLVAENPGVDSLKLMIAACEELKTVPGGNERADWHATTKPIFDAEGTAATDKVRFRNAMAIASMKSTSVTTKEVATKLSTLVELWQTIAKACADKKTANLCSKWIVVIDTCPVTISSTKNRVVPCLMFHWKDSHVDFTAHLTYDGTLWWDQAATDFSIIAVGEAKRLLSITPTDMLNMFGMEGRKIGICGLCHVPLVDKKSIATGFGPKCATVYQKMMREFERQQDSVVTSEEPVAKRAKVASLP